ncbi:pectin acetylesterase-family hydrolase [Paenibacillus riograndensis]|uniref:Conserved domain protein n=1 Tax=Paenibacillus riograndensis SBR5 TaxID=1073571 RepID=A0A0E3WI76_9BACL|nr:pectin acetylesterase-family hydrolase [Paenibacillus riograndensis]CQR56553.1 conserved domain protein [Paenibacillus riograndensis SBR5]
MKRKTGKWLKISLVALLALTLVGAGVVYAFVIKRPTQIAEYADTKPHKWNRVELGGNVRSSDGSEYYLLTKKGSSRNWIIFFSGGGVSWDAPSAASPMKITNILTGKDPGNYFANLPFYMLTLLDGIMADRPENPFREWNVAYIPYSTGDFHIGNRIAKYPEKDGSSLIVNYNGRNNVQSSLDWIYEHAVQPDKLLIAGESAGGFGSAFWAPEIAGHYKDAEIYQYSDSSFLYSDKWPGIVDNEWHADFKKNFGYPAAADLIGAAVRGNSRQMADGTVFLQSYSLYDEILTHFENKINDKAPVSSQSDAAAWSRRMTSAVRELAETLPNYVYFVTDDGLDAKKGTTSHTFATRDVLFKTEEDGVRLADWLDDIINKRQKYSVGGKLLSAPADEGERTEKKGAPEESVGTKGGE